MSRRTRHGASAFALVAGAALALAAASPAAAEDAVDAVAIRHQPVHCFVAGKYPQLDACFDPPSRVARARVYFRGEGGPEWYYVDMKAEAQCYRGTLPRPKKSLKRMRYYVAVTDHDFAEARTEEYAADVVTSDKACTIGAVAPYVTTATVVVSGAAALPAGFAAGAGLLAGVGTTTAVAGAAIVGAGTAGAVLAGGGTTTRPSHPVTTTTTSRPPASTTTTTSTTTLPGCSTRSGPPRVTFISPRDNEDVAARVAIDVDARVPGPSPPAIREVRLSAEEQGGSRRVAIATLPGPGPSFQATWEVPPCQGSSDRWFITALATDECDRTALERVTVRRRGANCQAQVTTAAPAPAAESPGLVWTTELAVAGGRGQVIANGAEVVFPGQGRSDVTLPARPGRNSVEAVLVAGDGAGTWRFTLAAGAIRPGSLSVVAGEAVAVGPETLAFRLRGRPGERAVFAFDLATPTP